MDDLIERLTELIDGDHDRGCDGRTYSCSCGFDDRIIATAKDVRDTLTRQREEIAALVECLTDVFVAPEKLDTSPWIDRAATLIGKKRY